MRHAPLIALVLSLIGLCVISVGIAYIYFPAAIIFAGAVFAYFGLIGIDVSDKAPKRRGPP